MMKMTFDKLKIKILAQALVIFSLTLFFSFIPYMNNSKTEYLPFHLLYSFLFSLEFFLLGILVFLIYNKILQKDLLGIQYSLVIRAVIYWFLVTLSFVLFIPFQMNIITIHILEYHPVFSQNIYDQPMLIFVFLVVSFILYYSLTFYLLLEKKLTYRKTITYLLLFFTTPIVLMLPKQIQVSKQVESCKNTVAIQELKECLNITKFMSNEVHYEVLYKLIKDFNSKLDRPHLLSKIEETDIRKVFIFSLIHHNCKKNKLCDIKDGAKLYKSMLSKCTQTNKEACNKTASEFENIDYNNKLFDWRWFLMVDILKVL